MTTKKTDAPTLYLVTNARSELAERVLTPGLLTTGEDRDELGAHDPDAIGYYELSSNNSEYLDMALLWPVSETTRLEFDSTWGCWTFDEAELGEPLHLYAGATWTRLLRDGMRLKPRKKTHPSLLAWPAMLGHLEVVRLLLEAGVDPKLHDPLSTAVAFGQTDTARVLLEHGADGSVALERMKANDTALKILEELGVS